MYATNHEHEPRIGQTYGCHGWNRNCL